MIDTTDDVATTTAAIDTPATGGTASSAGGTASSAGGTAASAGGDTVAPAVDDAVPPAAGGSPEAAETPADGRDAGMATAEYAIATVAAAGFAGLLVVILRSGEVRELLLGIIRSALSL